MQSHLILVAVLACCLSFKKGPPPPPHKSVDHNLMYCSLSLSRYKPGCIVELVITPSVRGVFNRGQRRVETRHIVTDSHAQLFFLFYVSTTNHTPGLNVENCYIFIERSKKKKK